MANHNPNGERNIAIPDENRPSWRPQDAQATSSRSRTNEDDHDYRHDYRSWRERNYRDDDRHGSDRDPRRWESGRGSDLGYDDREMSRSTERFGLGQSGYAAGRYGDDRSQHLHHRNEMVPSPGSFEDRHHDLGVDDRFTGRGSPGYWEERWAYDPERYQGGYGAGRGFEAERFGAWRGGQRGGAEWRGGASEWRGYDQGGYDPRMGRGCDSRGGHDQSLSGRGGGYDQRMGYQGSSSYGSQHMGYRAYGPSHQATQEEGHRHGGTEPHVHRGTGPHRGKGPQGYQRSDERLRELVCEALADDDQIDASQIQVSVKDGDVTLFGSVDDRYTRREAEDCVASVSGVRDVQIQLRVKDDRQMQAGQAAMSSSASRDCSSGQGGPAGNEA